MDIVYQLTEPIEGYQFCKVNFEIDDTHLNCDLGLIDNEVFVPKYTSAVVHKSNVIGYAGN